MNFRQELSSLRFATMPVTEDVLQDIFDKHLENWHGIEDAPRIWDYLGLSLEEYSNMVCPGDGLEQFFLKVSAE